MKGTTRRARTVEDIVAHATVVGEPHWTPALCAIVGRDLARMIRAEAYQRTPSLESILNPAGSQRFGPKPGANWAESGANAEK